MEINKLNEEIYSYDIQGRKQIKKLPERINGRRVKYRFLCAEDIELVQNNFAEKMLTFATMAIHELFQMYLKVYLAIVHNIYPKKKKEIIRKLKEINLAEVQQYILKKFLVQEGIYNLAFAIINNQNNIFTVLESAADNVKGQEAFDELLKQSIKKYIYKLTHKKFKPPVLTIIQSAEITQSTAITQSAEITQSTAIAQSAEINQSTAITQSAQITQSTAIVQLAAVVTAIPTTSAAYNEKIRHDDDDEDYYFLDEDEDKDDDDDEFFDKILDEDKDYDDDEFFDKILDDIFSKS